MLGGGANICYEYATKRYRSNCINWGMMPFTIDSDVEFNYDPYDYVFVPGIKTAVENGDESVKGYVISGDTAKEITLHMAGLTEKEREILLSGCLMNWYAERNK